MIVHVFQIVSAVFLASSTFLAHGAGSEDFVALEETKTQLESLFAKNDWAALDRLAMERVRAYEADPSQFAPYRTFFYALRRDDSPVTLAAYDAWVATYPKSYGALYARSRYLTFRGIKARGGEFVDKTPPERLKRMREYFVLASKDALHSLKLSKRPTMSYYQLVRMSYYLGEKHDAYRYYVASTQIDPDVLIIAEQYLQSCMPRWGGSFEELEKFADEARRRGLTPEKTSQLRFEAKLRAASDYRLHGQTRLADSILTQLRSEETSDARRAEVVSAFAFGAIEGGDFLLAEQYADQLATIDIASASDLNRLGYRFATNGRLEQAARYYRAALARDSGNAYALMQLGAYFRDTNRAKEAIEHYDRAIAIEPSNQWALSGRGWVRFRLMGDAKGSLQDLSAAASLGEASAQAILGHFYWNGVALTKDPAEAIYWWELAAAQKQKNAIEDLRMARRRLGAEYSRMLEEARLRH